MLKIKNNRRYIFAKLIALVTLLTALTVFYFFSLPNRIVYKKDIARHDISILFDRALTLFELDNTFYPSTAQGLSALYIKPRTNPKPSNWRGPYIRKNILNDPWKNPYQYTCPGEHNRNMYDLYSLGPDGIVSSDDIVKRR
ncbi:MAG: type II secretion system major pseudopilin GspG [Candidatus Ancaeobacter aquaticus]|nr:type II secretion system major pseudopilin GspG [Candidatus Ancaeobacter aquaticus]